MKTKLDTLLTHQAILADIKDYMQTNNLSLSQTIQGLRDDKGFNPEPGFKLNEQAEEFEIFLQTFLGTSEEYEYFEKYIKTQL